MKTIAQKLEYFKSWATHHAKKKAITDAFAKSSRIVAKNSYKRVRTGTAADAVCIKKLHKGSFELTIVLLLLNYIYYAMIFP